MNPKNFAINFAKEAGQIIKDNFSLTTKKQWKKGFSPVTETDFKINKLLIEKVKQEFPGLGVLAEEESYQTERENLWVCDPIDGTIPFSHGIPISTFSLALVKNGQSILGVVYDPFMDRLYFAEKHKGAFLNNQKIKVSDSKTLTKGYVNIEEWSRAPFRFPGAQNEISSNGALVAKLVSVVYGAMMVANGNALATIFAGPGAHDIAAAKIIVEEAGGKVTDIFGNDQDYNKPIKGAVLSNDQVHTQLIQIIQKNLIK